MKACIHRGATQIGGSCVELESNSHRLLIDLGLPLDAKDASGSFLPVSLRTENPEDMPWHIVISHPHVDHYGLLHHMPSSTNVITGKAARAIIAAAAPFTGQQTPPLSGPVLEDRKPLKVGPFTITPFLVDHSAYDAYSLLIEAEGRRVFYSGDFRGHGRKSSLHEKLITTPPSSIHALLMEGTSIGRPESTEFRYPTEEMLESQMTEAFMTTTGLAMVHTSAQNIDRVVTMFRSARKSGRELVIDLYAAAILEATGNARLPQSDWEGVRLFIPHSQRLQVKKNKWFELLDRHKTRRIYGEALAEDPGRYCLLFRPLHQLDLDRSGCLEGAHYIYSQWMGYWDGGSYDTTRQWLNDNGIPFQAIHTSGHADPQTLKRFVKALAPERLVPIHSFHPEHFPDLYHTVEPHGDGEWWDV